MEVRAVVAAAEGLMALAASAVVVSVALVVVALVAAEPVEAGKT